MPLPPLLPPPPLSPIHTSQIMQENEKIQGLYWEPNGTRFALVLGDGDVPAGVAFYNVAPAGIQHLFTLESRSANVVEWNPRGEFCVIAGSSRAVGGGKWAGRYEFFDVERRRSLATQQHSNATGFEWDASGRSFASFKTSTDEPDSRGDHEGNGYVLYNFQGVRICERNLPKVYLFKFRPRPPCFLSPAEVAAATRNLKAVEKRFNEIDNADDMRRALLARLRKRIERDDFRASLIDADERVMYVKEQYGIESDEVLEETVDEIISETVTLV